MVKISMNPRRQDIYTNRPQISLRCSFLPTSHASEQVHVRENETGPNRCEVEHPETLNPRITRKQIVLEIAAFPMIQLF